MRYISTRGQTEPLSFTDAVVTGMAPDGGLLLPESIPDVRDRLGAWRGLPYVELAREVIRPFADLEDSVLDDLLSRSLSTFREPEVTPLRTVGDVHVLELFHGPTLAFKDVALQFLGNLFEYILETSGGHLNILGATSGDTGSAAIAGVKGRRNMRIFMLHPEGRTSRVQMLQMTTVTDDNVFNLAVDGTFDDCQAIVKTLFEDLDFKREHALGAVNSINWARVLAQVVYYFYGAFRAMDKTGAERVRFAVPTGNFGDILAGYLAWRMGLPVGRLVLATNKNDILARFFATGEYVPGTVHATISPSMDIQVASNFERYLFYRSGCRPERVRAMMTALRDEGRFAADAPADDAGVDPLVAGTADEDVTLETIRRLYRDHEYLADPHTAVGVAVGSEHLVQEEPMVCLATAHPSKFGDAITRALGVNCAHHPSVDGLEDLPRRCTRMDASASNVRQYITEHAR
jgi:threonine synthase